MLWISGLLQWLHVLAAVLAVGGVFFLRFILCPALKNLSPEAGETKKFILQTVVRRFKLVIHGAIAVLLATGFYRYLSSLPKLEGWSLYHALMGTKIILAFALFTVAIFLVMPGAQPNLFQRNRDRWLLFNFAAGAVIILISATLRRLWDFPH